MKYNAPPGGDPTASYVDGNRSAGIKGSVVPAAAVEFPQRELAHLIGFAGLTPDNDDLEQVRKSIEALIAAATGGGDTSQFLLVSQARSRLPIFPEVNSADGRINVLSPAAGSVQVPSLVSFMHRGIFPVSTSDYDEVDRTFATAASKTYHLRWNPTDGFSLNDLADALYNPDVRPETDVAFDTTYDDMLVARVVTDGSNVATITNLANETRLSTVVTGFAQMDNSPAWSTLAGSSVVLNWGRCPIVSEVAIQGVLSWDSGVGGWTDPAIGTLGAVRLRKPPIGASRYGCANLQYYYDDTNHNRGAADYVWSFMAI